MEIEDKRERERKNDKSLYSSILSATSRSFLSFFFFFLFLSLTVEKRLHNVASR